MNTRETINHMFANLIIRIGIDVPSNYEAIVDYIYEDVCDSADDTNWHSGDVDIAFRRWIESRA
jgi:hypothetical protein